MCFVWKLPNTPKWNEPKTCAACTKTFVSLHLARAWLTQSRALSENQHGQGAALVNTQGCANRGDLFLPILSLLERFRGSTCKCKPSGGLCSVMCSCVTEPLQNQGPKRLLNKPNPPPSKKNQPTSLWPQLQSAHTGYLTRSAEDAYIFKSGPPPHYPSFFSRPQNLVPKQTSMTVIPEQAWISWVFYSHAANTG